MTPDLASCNTKADTHFPPPDRDRCAAGMLPVTTVADTQEGDARTPPKQTKPGSTPQRFRRPSTPDKSRGPPLTQQLDGSASLNSSPSVSPSGRRRGPPSALDGSDERVLATWYSPCAPHVQTLHDEIVEARLLKKQKEICRQQVLARHQLDVTQRRERDQQQNDAFKTQEKERAERAQRERQKEEELRRRQFRRSFQVASKQHTQPRSLFDDMPTSPCASPAALRRSPSPNYGSPTQGGHREPGGMFGFWGHERD